VTTDPDAIDPDAGPHLAGSGGGERTIAEASVIRSGHLDRIIRWPREHRPGS
jgi:hypothetical protein